MAISCTPSDLSTNAKCFVCLSPDERQAITIYLLQQIAGLGATSTATLLANAKCFACLPPDVAQQLQVYLLCQIVNK